jgi:choline dehydrogenase-like flavoprotein
MKNSIADPIANGLANGWQVLDGATLSASQEFEADVIVIGSGAGGGTSAEILAKAGLRVLIVEEGRLYYQKDFNMDELAAYPKLYQEGMSRVTADGSIAILQGRCVGGSTTVNWTASFRTPPATLNYWADQFGLDSLRPERLTGWFDNRIDRHHIEPWATRPNENNDILRRGCEALGFEWAVIPRNVKACWNLGYCGVGCPANAKQGALLTTIPGALNHQAQLIYGLRADRLTLQQDRIESLLATPMAEDGITPRPYQVRLRARHFVIAASAMGSPGLLLRSKVPDPYERLGTRTFLHPVNATVADMPDRVDPFYGAPQSIYSDQFVFSQGVDGPAGFKLEVPPLHPALTAGVLPGHGETHQADLARLPFMQTTIALLRDGFHPESSGGQVALRPDGSPVLSYPITDYLWAGMRQSFLRMAEIQFAAGAKRVRLLHLDSPWFHSWKEARSAIASLPMKAHRVRVFTAHQMGGCGMGADPRQSVANAYGEHHQVANLSIHDASLFPTSLGVNPQLTIYMLAARNSTRLASRLINAA